ncbi:hypothetical protein CALCODRAFT_492355 [Calocera cornea HHB12733]|uniref:CNH domain-containing protein n=1 Tax=Calocera cornea HHB12733 TaxID=1353952 RepID=A0A165IGV2_9BASI|nr:hypothetical protein CALCODRAFT_492355 [Calocera cornea HHB12733]
MFTKVRELVRKPKPSKPNEAALPHNGAPIAAAEPARPEQLREVFKLAPLGTSTAARTDPPNIPFTSNLVSVSTFTIPANRAVQLLVAACEDGIWFGRAADPGSVKLSIALPKVTACVLMPEEEALLVISDRELLLFSTQCLPPGQAKSPLQKLDKNVDSLITTFLQGKQMVVYSTRKGGDYKVHVFEPAEDGDLPHASFEKLHELSITSPFTSLHPLTSRLALPCAFHWELLDPSRFRSEHVAHPKKPVSGRVRREDVGRGLGCVELTGEVLLLVYDEYGAILDRTSKQVVRSTVWKNKVSRAAFRPPYVLLFGASMVEVRHMGTLELVQLLQAEGVRCLSLPMQVRPKRERLENWEGEGGEEVGVGAAAAAEEVWACMSAGVGGEGQRIVRLSRA